MKDYLEFAGVFSAILIVLCSMYFVIRHFVLLKRKKRDYLLKLKEENKRLKNRLFSIEINKNWESLDKVMKSIITPIIEAEENTKIVTDLAKE